MRLSPWALRNATRFLAQMPEYAFDFYSIGLDIASDVYPLSPTFEALDHNWNLTIHGGWDVSRLDFMQIAQKAGLKAERHRITTSDGYINTLFRVYEESPLQPDSTHKPTLFLQHGILASSDDFVINKPDKAPALVAAKAGYDVWVGNSRGNRYSRGHLSLDPDRDAEYWEFSFTELGIYDTPAFLDYIY
jgi:pimeloyl-ACP methyl ester carboxylesterase